VVYARKVNDQTLTFHVSGQLWKRSLVMADAETKSLWSHILGEAMDGKLKGTVLESIPSEMVTWKAWREQRPESTVLNLDRTSGEYSREFYRQPNQFVLGFAVNGRPHHCTFATMRSRPLQNLKMGDEPLLLTFDWRSTSARLYSRRLDGRELTFSERAEGRIKDDQTGSIWDRGTGQALEGPLKGKYLEAKVAIVSYTQVWREFHPKTQAIEADDAQNATAR
jgi:hypothetical protein